MKAPTIEEVLLHAAKIGLSEPEARMFWFYYDSKGWTVGRTPMKQWRSAIAGWKLRGEGRQQPSTSANLVLFQKEYERIIARLKSIKGTYGDLQTWRKEDLAEYKKLSDRKKELKTKLGIVL